MLEILLLLNALWFASAFHLFALRGKIFAKVVVPREHRDTPVLETLIMSGKFLGGFNLAFSVLNVLLFLNRAIFDNDTQWAILLSVCALAHATQFAYNVPVALQNRRGAGVWQVRGLMLFIFATDFALMALNAALAVFFFV